MYQTGISIYQSNCDRTVISMIVQYANREMFLNMQAMKIMVIPRLEFDSEPMRLNGDY